MRAATRDLAAVLATEPSNGSSGPCVASSLDAREACGHPGWAPGRRLWHRARSMTAPTTPSRRSAWSPCWHPWSVR